MPIGKSKCLACGTELPPAPDYWDYDPEADVVAEQFSKIGAVVATYTCSRCYTTHQVIYLPISTKRIN